jgi:hypothetical protein
VLSLSDGRIMDNYINEPIEKDFMPQEMTIQMRMMTIESDLVKIRPMSSRETESHLTMGNNEEG